MKRSSIRSHAPGLLLLLAALELGASAWACHRAPPPEAYASLVPELSAWHRPGDLLVVSPRWAEPHVRAAMGDAFFPLAMVARAGSETFERALEVSVLGAHAEELAGFEEVKKESVGPFELRELRNPRYEPVVFDFVDAIARGQATAWGAEPAERCRYVTGARIRSGGLAGHPTFPSARFECPEGGYYNVSATVIADQRFLPRRCIYAHPPPSGTRTIRVLASKLGSRLVGDTGLYWLIERERKWADVSLTIRVDGSELGRVVHHDGDGFSRFEFPLGEHAHKSGASVEFEIHTDDANYRHFCFRVDSR